MNKFYAHCLLVQLFVPDILVDGQLILAVRVEGMVE